MLETGHAVYRETKRPKLNVFGAVHYVQKGVHVPELRLKLQMWTNTKPNSRWSMALVVYIEFVQSDAGFRVF